MQNQQEPTNLADELGVCQQRLDTLIESALRFWLFDRLSHRKWHIEFRRSALKFQASFRLMEGLPSMEGAYDSMISQTSLTPKKTHFCKTQQKAFVGCAEDSIASPAKRTRVGRLQTSQHNTPGFQIFIGPYLEHYHQRCLSHVEKLKRNLQALMLDVSNAIHTLGLSTQPSDVALREKFSLLFTKIDTFSECAENPNRLIEYPDIAHRIICQLQEDTNQFIRTQTELLAAIYNIPIHELPSNYDNLCAFINQHVKDAEAFPRHNKHEQVLDIHSAIQFWRRLLGHSYLLFYSILVCTSYDVDNELARPTLYAMTVLSEYFVENNPQRTTSNIMQRLQGASARQEAFLEYIDNDWDNIDRRKLFEFYADFEVDLCDAMCLKGQKNASLEEHAIDDDFIESARQCLALVVAGILTQYIPCNDATYEAGCDAKRAIDIHQQEYPLIAISQVRLVNLLNDVKVPNPNDKTYQAYQRIKSMVESKLAILAVQQSRLEGNIISGYHHLQRATHKKIKEYQDNQREVEYIIKVFNSPSHAGLTDGIKSLHIVTPLLNSIHADYQLIHSLTDVLDEYADCQQRLELTPHDLTVGRDENPHQHGSCLLVPSMNEGVSSRDDDKRLKSFLQASNNLNHYGQQLKALYQNFLAGTLQCYNHWTSDVYDATVLVQESVSDINKAFLLLSSFQVRKRAVIQHLQKITEEDLNFADIAKVQHETLIRRIQTIDESKAALKLQQLADSPVVKTIVAKLNSLKKEIRDAVRALPSALNIFCRYLGVLCGSKDSTLNIECDNAIDKLKQIHSKACAAEQILHQGINFDVTLQALNKECLALKEFFKNIKDKLCVEFCSFYTCISDEDSLSVDINTPLVQTIMRQVKRTVDLLHSGNKSLVDIEHTLRSVANGDITLPNAVTSHGNKKQKLQSHRQCRLVSDQISTWLSTLKDIITQCKNQSAALVESRKQISLIINQNNPQTSFCELCTMGLQRGIIDLDSFITRCQKMLLAINVEPQQNVSTSCNLSM